MVWLRCGNTCFLCVHNRLKPEETRIDVTREYLVFALNDPGLIHKQNNNMTLVQKLKG